MNKRKTIIKLIYIIFIITFIISSYQIIKWIIDNRNANKQVNKINQNSEIKNIKDNSSTEIINNEADKFDPYWDFIKMDLIDVDINKLKLINSETKGWLQVKGTNINYPFVQAKNNDYYLNHSFDKSPNGGGWVFLDYRNNIQNTDKNTIIYAHGRQNKTMFGSLKNILDSKWTKNSDNYVIKLSTEYENTLWQVFSVYRIPTTNDYLKIKFNNDNDFLEFINKILNRSNYDFKTSVSKNDRILTLSTCYNNHDKIVMHAKLIKRQKNNY